MSDDGLGMGVILPLIMAVVVILPMMMDDEPTDPLADATKIVGVITDYEVYGENASITVQNDTYQSTTYNVSLEKLDGRLDMRRYARYTLYLEPITEGAIANNSWLVAYKSI